MNPSPPTRSLACAVLAALRPLQWSKNLLLAAPLVLSHGLHHPARLRAVALAFLAFSLTASAGYILNDLHDLEHDRHHPRKCRRPLAAGELSAAAALGLTALLLILAAGLAAWIKSWPFGAILGLYFGISLVYSFDFKRRLLVDVLTLAGLYTLRIFAGGAATEVVVSPWLMALSMFLFLSLAFVKRYAELINTDGDEPIKGRNYAPSDLGIIESIGPACGCMAVMVLALYVDAAGGGRGIFGTPVPTVTTLTALTTDPAGRPLYRHPQLLWLVCPLLLYWITRIWFIARRKALHEDPLLFALTDRISWMCGILTAMVGWLAV